MCLILFAYDCHPDYRLILAANRDEFFSRPAAPLGFWEDRPQILAGRDLEQSGTWMGVTLQGKFAAITNYREPARQIPDAPSRGHLVSNFLGGRQSAEAYTQTIFPTANQYNGFNLLTGDTSSLHYYSNRGGKPRVLAPGIYGLSNRLLNTPWPKISTGVSNLASIIESGRSQLPEKLTELLQRQETAPDNQLPDTGVGYSMEKMLSPIFITSRNYGTRCSTILTIDRNGHIWITEFTWQPGQPVPTLMDKQTFSITIENTSKAAGP